ncbi:hypothetical protein J3R30DRAFT_3473684 [Lentinula aciculospora]|uniref:Uncharacterized protein n=1 Tax=Lentinula aciculospora TaxID=153920 RepID=A0A9W9ABJ8_9AGAR|nr:hypothetical protein J3R30DRAFT_3473684 [Lentinula aciculospora]
MSFSMTHSVILPYPIDRVFPALSSADQMERLQKLTPEAQEFSLLPSDLVLLPCNALSALNHAYAMPVDCPRPRKLLPPSLPDKAANADTRQFKRTRFEFSGTVPILFGLINLPLSVAGAQIIDEEAKVVLFESCVAAQGIEEVKLRTFREISLEDGSTGGADGLGKPGTEVTETVWGTCPFVLSILLKFLAPRVHKHHMELYDRLFKPA